MNKKMLVDKIADQYGLTKKDVGKIVTSVFGTIVEGLKEDGNVTIVNFGTMRLQEQGARKARNPRTGDEVEVPQKTVVKFKPSSNLKKEFL